MSKKIFNKKSSRSTCILRNQPTIIQPILIQTTLIEILTIKQTPTKITTLKRKHYTRKDKATMQRLFREEVVDNMEIESPTASLRRIMVEKTISLGVREDSTLAKKAKGNFPTSIHNSAPHLSSFRFWLGFSAVEKLAKDDGLEELQSEERIMDMVIREVPQEEVEEVMEAQAAFPRIPQLLYPMARSDNILGQHFNLTQVPFDIPTNPHTGLFLDFHVAIHFELPTQPLFYDAVKDMTMARLNHMGIALGTDLINPIAVLCKGVKNGGGAERYMGYHHQATPT